MHAILLMAASHLKYLQPKEEQFHKAEGQHLSRTLAGFRTALTVPVSEDNADVLLSCSILLLHHAWTVPYSSNQASEEYNNIDIDIGADNLLQLSVGLKYVALSMWEVREQSIFNHIISSKTIHRIKDWNAKLPSMLDPPRFWTRHLTLTDGDLVEGNYDGCSDALERLLPVLKCLGSAKCMTDHPDVVSDIGRYLCLWPVKSSDDFLRLAKANEPRCLLVLFSFYLCMSNLASKHFWWVRDRAGCMCNALHMKLENEAQEWRDLLADIDIYVDACHRRASS